VTCYPCWSATSPPGDGVGSKFVGTLDPGNDPTAQAAVEPVHPGNAAEVPVLIDEMNAHGTQYTERSDLTRSCGPWATTSGSGRTC
jgi:hypothetical protein